jgi:flagellar biosynthesis chaperone FliJ
VKKFKYKLEAVLEHKKRSLDSVKKVQSEMLREKALIVDELRSIQEHKNEALDITELKSIRDLQLHESRITGYRRKENELIKKASNIDEKINKNSVLLKKAHIEKKSFETDKERKLDKYIKDLNMKTEIGMSDLVIQKFARRS